MLTESRIAFVGSGAMAEAVISGLLKQRIARAENLVAAGPRAERGQGLRDHYGIAATTDNAQAVQGADDDLGLGDVRRTVPQRIGQHGVAPVQRHRQRQVRAGVLRTRPRRVRQPLPGITSSGRLRHITSRRQDPELQLTQPALGPRQLPQRLRLVLGAHERRVAVGHRLQGGLDRCSGTEDRMQHRDSPRGRRHGQAHEWQLFVVIPWFAHTVGH